MNLFAFKAYDIRGKYPEEINESLAFLVGRAIVNHLSAKIIVVGRDMRLSSKSLSDKIIEGIISEGADVVDVGLVTTPMLNFAIANYGYDGGVMISASHNPKDDNAFKIIDSDVVQIDELNGLQDIKKSVKFDLGISSVKQGTIVQKNILDDYKNHIIRTIGIVSSLNIVSDFGNGVGSISAVPVFKDLGLKVKGMFVRPDGRFPNHPANPHDICNFNDLINKVKKRNADLGLFFDGDADRVNFVDDLGRIVPTDLIAALLAQEELSDKKSKFVYYDLRFSKVFPEIIRKAGGNPIMMRAGNPFFKRILREKGGVIGAEFSGHIIFPDNFNIDDGLFAALKVMKMISKRGQKLSDLINSIATFSTSPEESVQSKNPTSITERLIAAYPQARQIELDGLYLDFDDGFISVRQSQSEQQLYRIRVEAKTSEEMKLRFNTVKSIVVGGD